MHELSIAESVVRAAERHAGDRVVTRVQLKVGHLRQVVPSALEFAFELVTQGTRMEGAVLEQEEVPAVGRCRSCGVESELDWFPLACDGCGGLDLDVVRGEELLIESLEVEEPQPLEEVGHGS